MPRVEEGFFVYIDRNLICYQTWQAFQEVLIMSKNGIGDGLQPVPPEQEGGKEKKQKFSTAGRDTG